MDANHSNSGRPPRRPVVPGRSPVFVETEVYRRVREAVEAGDTPALILGLGGSGKTSLLAALADEWASYGRKVVFLSLYEFGRGEDILLLLRRRLAEMSLLPRTMWKLWLDEAMTQPTRDGVNSMTVCQPMVMMFARPCQRDDTSTIGPGSR